MKQKINYSQLLVLGLSFLFFSCKTEPVKIKIIGNGNSDSDTLVFDSKETIITNGLIDSIYLEPNKTHKVSINNAKPIEFTIKNKDGILNLYNKDFIIQNVDYSYEGTEGKKYGMTEIQLSYFVLIDSSLICKKVFENELKDEKKINDLLNTILKNKNGNYKSVFSEKEKLIEDDYDTSEMVYGFKKIGKDNLFIEKFWNFDINEKIPEEMSTKVRNDDKNYNQERTLNALVLANDFLTYAKNHPNKFTVININKLRKQ